MPDQNEPERDLPNSENGADAANGMETRHRSGTSVIQATVASLQEMIRDGRLRPGAVLPPQRGLANDLEVSRATLREALSILGTIGQIVTEPGRRSRVTNPDATVAATPWRFAARYSPSEVYRFRHLAESHAAQLAAIHRTASDLEEMGANNDAFRKAASENVLPAYAKADFAFHQTIMRISRNNLLIDLHRTFSNVLFESQRLSTERRGNLFQAVAEHDQILKAVTMNDPEGASYYMGKHISMAASRAGLPVSELP